MLPQEITKLIGKTGETVIREVEKGAIKKYADAVNDFNPLYWDEKYARNLKYSSVVAPPGFFGWPVKWANGMPVRSALMEELMINMNRAGYPRGLDAGIEYDFFHSVFADDNLTAVSKIADIYEREAKAGKMILSVIETSYTNQNSVLVAKVRQSLIFR